MNAYKPGIKAILPNSRTSEMTDFLDGALYFGYPQNLPRLAWYTSGPTINWRDVPSLEFNDDAGEYQAMTQCLRAIGLNPIVVDLNGACWPGVSVVRVIVPELTAACVAAHPYLGHRRYYDPPRRPGDADHTMKFDDLNPDPIPFP
jgi:ribosomal protein S12 methylthiotransferase accessory factor